MNDSPVNDLRELKVFVSSLLYEFYNTTRLAICDYKENGGVTFDDETQEYAIVSLYGGLNGNGNWYDYLDDLKSLVNKLQSKYDSVWLIELINDCQDDVFYVKIGVRF